MYKHVQPFTTFYIHVQLCTALYNNIQISSTLYNHVQLYMGGDEHSRGMNIAFYSI